MTDILYMEDIKDCYIRDFKAKVEKVFPEESCIILDRTAFYPLGGGQPNDIGVLKWKGGSCKVIDVRKKNKVVHVVEGQLPEEGETVIGELDWPLRYSHMRMHTAQHLLSAIIWNRYGSSTVGNQIHADYSHIDFHPADFTMEQLKEVEIEMNDLIKKGGEIDVQTLPRIQIEKEIEQERVDLSRLPSSIKEFRTVIIGNQGYLDKCPCAGTHIKDLKELKGIEIIRRKSKGKGKVRVQYRLE